MGRTTQAVNHGLSYRTSTTNTDFQLERIRVCQGIFPLFYEAQTSHHISTAKNSFLDVRNLLGYCSEIGYQYQLAGYGNYKILPSLAALVLDQQSQQSWTILGILAMAEFNDFLNFHVNFLNIYQEIESNVVLYSTLFGTAEQDWYFFRFFQEITPLPIIADRLDISVHRDKIRDALRPYFSFHYFDDRKEFDVVLPYTDSANLTSMPITEALAIYAVMFYLSSLVRYRPNYLETLLSTKPAWLIENFVNSTPGTFLRIMVSQIIGTDYIFRRR